MVNSTLTIDEVYVLVQNAGFGMEWKISDSAYMGRHITGRDAQLKVDIEVDGRTIDLGVSYTVEAETPRAEMILAEIVKLCASAPKEYYLVVPCTVVAEAIQHGLSASRAAEYKVYTQQSEASAALSTLHDHVPLRIEAAKLDVSKPREIPAQAISFWSWDREENVERHEALKRELLHELSQQTEMCASAQEWQVKWSSSANDDVLFVDPRTQEHIIVHLTWSSMPERVGFPSMDRYPSFDEWCAKVLCVEELEYY